MHGLKRVQEMINDKELVSYNQLWYEENIMEWYKFILEKKELIKKRQKLQMN